MAIARVVWGTISSFPYPIQASAAINAQWLTYVTVAPTRLMCAARDNSACEIARLPLDYELPSVSRQQIVADPTYGTRNKFIDRSFLQRLLYRSLDRVQRFVCPLLAL